MDRTTNQFNNLFTAIPESVVENQKQYQAEADAIAKNRKPLPDGDCPCTRGEDGCQVHGKGDRLQEVLSQWHEAHRAQFVRDGYTNLLESFDTQEQKHVHVGAKYARLDVGGSGAWMLEISTGVIFGIKGYGTPDKKKIAGDINDPSFDGAILFRDRFRHGRFDNRTAVQS